MARHSVKPTDGSSDPPCNFKRCSNHRGPTRNSQARVDNRAYPPVLDARRSHFGSFEESWHAQYYRWLPVDLRGRRAESGVRWPEVGRRAVKAAIVAIERGGNAADAAATMLLAICVTDSSLFCFGREVRIICHDGGTGQGWRRRRIATQFAKGRIRQVDIHLNRSAAFRLPNAFPDAFRSRASHWRGLETCTARWSLRWFPRRVGWCHHAPGRSIARW